MSATTATAEELQAIDTMVAALFARLPLEITEEIMAGMTRGERSEAMASVKRHRTRVAAQR